MSTATLLLQDYDVEISNTRRTLERLPEDNPDWACHPKSMALGKLAMHCATLPMLGLFIIEDEGMDMANSTRPQAPLTFTTREACLGRLDNAAAQCRAAIAAASDEHLAKLWRFSFGEHLISNNPRSQSFRIMCVNHLIHHTAQLGVYLRSKTSPSQPSTALRPTSNGRLRPSSCRRRPICIHLPTTAEPAAARGAAGVQPLPSSILPSSPPMLASTRPRPLATVRHACL